MNRCRGLSFRHESNLRKVDYAHFTYLESDRNSVHQPMAQKRTSKSVLKPRHSAKHSCWWGEPDGCRKSLFQTLGTMEFCIGERPREHFGVYFWDIMQQTTSHTSLNWSGTQLCTHLRLPVTTSSNRREGHTFCWHEWVGADDGSEQCDDALRLPKYCPAKVLMLEPQLVLR